MVKSYFLLQPYCEHIVKELFNKPRRKHQLSGLLLLIPILATQADWCVSIYLKVQRYWGFYSSSWFICKCEYIAGAIVHLFL